MTVAYLASDDAAFRAGQLTVTLGIPVIGLVCLIIGLVQRSRDRSRPGPYPPPYQPPPGFPVNIGYPYPPGAPPPPMGYPGPYPAPPYPGYGPGFPPRRRAGKSATTLIIVGALLLAFGILGNFARIAARNAERPRGAGLLPTGTSMRVGECISQMDYRATLFSSRPGNDCANEFNTFELAFKGGPSDTCPDGKREHSDYSRYTDESTILCFALNLKQGECYRWNRNGDDVTIDVGDCNDTRSAQVRVAQRIDGSTDKTQCKPGGKAISYPVPPRVYCLVRADS